MASTIRNSIIHHEERPIAGALFHACFKQSQRRPEVITLSAIKHYDTARHQRWRAAVLRRAGYICQECARYGRRTPQGLPVPATVAHHIQSIEEHPELRLDPGNGEALCASCHNARHPEKGGRKW